MKTKPYFIDARTLAIPAVRRDASEPATLVVDRRAKALKAVTEWLEARWAARPGRPLKVTITELRSTRTLSQNRLYWAVHIPALVQVFKDLSGEPWTPEDAHELAKHKWLDAPELIDPETGEVVKGLKTTTTADTEAFGRYLARIEAWLRDFAGVHLYSDYE